MALSWLTEDRIASEWPASEAGSFAAYSTDTNDVTVWKGFQRNYAEGLRLLQLDAQTDAASRP